MKLTIPAWKNTHYIGLAEILLLLGRLFSDMKWYVKIEEVAPEPGADMLENIDPNIPIDIYTLLHLATPSVQIIDGLIIATDSDVSEPNLILRAVDSTSWDIETKHKEVNAIVRAEYPDAQEFD